MNRRRFLTGVGGSFLALPFLESLRGARADAPSEPYVPLFVMRTGNGVQQEDNGEPDRFCHSPELRAAKADRPRLRQRLSRLLRR